MNAPWSRLTRRSKSFKPAKADEELMENVRTRLTMLGGLNHPNGTVIRTIPGATVRFLEMAGTVVAAVFTKEETPRPVGSITQSGEIVYIQPRTS